MRDEQALQTAAVASQIARIEALVQKLVHFLRGLDPGGKGPLRQLAHQLVQGSKEQKTLTGLIDELTRAKSNLGLRIQVANVGLTRNVEGSLTVNSAILHRVDEALQVALGEGQGLKLSARLSNRAEQGMRAPRRFNKH